MMKLLIALIGLSITSIQALVIMPPFACMCASGDGR
jgi:hypothetical protein